MTADVDLTPPPPSLKRPLFKLVMAALVLVLVAGALVVSRIDIGGTSAVAEPSYRYTHPNEIVQSPPITPREPVTEEPVADAPPFAELVEEPKLEPKKPTQKPKKKQWRPRRQPTTEDLYDTR